MTARCSRHRVADSCKQTDHMTLDPSGRHYHKPSFACMEDFAASCPRLPFCVGPAVPSGASSGLSWNNIRFWCGWCRPCRRAWRPRVWAWTWAGPKWATGTVGTTHCSNYPLSWTDTKTHLKQGRIFIIDTLYTSPPAIWTLCNNSPE